MEKIKQNTWVQELCAGKESAYKILFEEYYPLLGHFAFKYVKDVTIAEDIVHDIILDIYVHRRQFENLVALKSFLFLSIKNRCLNYLQHLKAQEHYIQEKRDKESEEFFLDHLMEEEVFYLLKKAIAELPRHAREIYELSLQGLSNEEIAAKLALSLDSVKAYKKRGKQILRSRLKGLTYFFTVIF